MAADSDNKNSKLFGRFNELVLLLITIVFGGILGYIFQQRGWSRQHKEALCEAERAEAQKVFSDLSVSMDARLFLMQRILWGLENGAQRIEMRRRWHEYEKEVVVWNSTFHKNVAMLQSYFGQDASQTLYRYVQDEFRDINDSLRRLPTKPPTSDAQQVQKKLDKLHDAIFVLDKKLLDAILSGKVGQCHDSTKVSSAFH